MNHKERIESIADKLNSHVNGKVYGEYIRQDNTTTTGSIYNKIFSEQIKEREYRSNYFNDNNDLDINKVTTRLKQLNTEIDKQKDIIELFEAKVVEELENKMLEEMNQESSQMKKQMILGQYMEKLDNISSLPTHQNLSSELNDLYMEKSILTDYQNSYELENKDIIEKLLREKKTTEVAAYLDAKEN